MAEAFAVADSSHPVCPVADLPPGARRCVEAFGRRVTVFNCDGTFYAVDDACPHRGGSLAEGAVQGRVIYCPLHDWNFDLATGVSPSIPQARVRAYAVEVADGLIRLRE